MPKLIKLYIVHCLMGFGLSALFVAALLAFDVANLGHLVASSPVGWIAVAMLFFGNGIVFAGVQFAISIMRLGDGDGPSGGRPAPRMTSEPVRVMAEATKPADVLRRR